AFVQEELAATLDVVHAIGTLAGEHGIVAAVDVDRVVALVPPDQLAPADSLVVEGVAAGAPDHRVVAAPGEERVGAAIAEDEVGAGSGVDEIAAVARIIAADDGLRRVRIRGHDVIGAVTAEQNHRADGGGSIDAVVLGTRAHRTDVAGLEDDG